MRRRFFDRFRPISDPFRPDIGPFSTRFAGSRGRVRVSLSCKVRAADREIGPAAGKCVQRPDRERSYRGGVPDRRESRRSVVREKRGTLGLNSSEGRSGLNFGKCRVGSCFGGSIGFEFWESRLGLSFGEPIGFESLEADWVRVIDRVARLVARLDYGKVIPDPRLCRRLNRRPGPSSAHRALGCSTSYLTLRWSVNWTTGSMMTGLIT